MYAIFPSYYAATCKVVFSMHDRFGRDLLNEMRNQESEKSIRFHNWIKVFTKSRLSVWAKYKKRLLIYGRRNIYEIVREIVRVEKLQNDFDPIAMIQYGWLTIFIPCDFVDWKASIWAIEPLKLTSRQQLSWCGHFPYEW